MQVELGELADLRRKGTPRGIVSVCSAHPVVLRAALRHGRRHGSTVLIEATCNQVNHRGGYTGLLPAGFAALVRQIAAEEGCPEGLLVLGGDHLGPSPWRGVPAEQAMAEAERMVAAYVAAGFRKIHLDASMGCRDEPDALDDETTAGRAVRLAKIAETVARDTGELPPLYVIGTEVPPPGGADHVLDAIEPTSLDSALRTIEVHREVFAEAGLSDAFSRVIGVVVQPGVEFGNRNVVYYDRARAQGLRHVLAGEPRFVFEAHSTDYQGKERLAALVEDGFAILKVGPELTFVLREALYGLDRIASDLVEGFGQRPLMTTMEALMLKHPDDWNRHYREDAADTGVLRHESLSDRIRYYWARPEAIAAVDRLVAALKGRSIPAALFDRHLPDARCFSGTPLNPVDVLIHCVSAILAAYNEACRA